VGPRASFDAVSLPGIEPRSSSQLPSAYTEWAAPAHEDLYFYDLHENDQAEKK